jgi:hypothetical protein
MISIYVKNLNDLDVQKYIFPRLTAACALDDAARLKRDNALSKFCAVLPFPWRYTSPKKLIPNGEF